MKKICESCILRSVGCVFIKENTEDKCETVKHYDEGYNESELPTFNDLYANGTMKKEGTCIENEYDYTTKKWSLSKSDIESIMLEFKENGFNITREALEHNYNAWCRDEKSGYRDEVNNYHLFSPCGCNPLSFRATTLHEKCADWQHTYTC